MNAVVLVRHGSADGAFQFREMPDPVPRRGEVRIAVEVSGLNFADVLAREGLYGEIPRLPCILGFDVAGRIDAVGEDVLTFRPGMRVVAMVRFGGYASKVIARTYGVAEIPEDLDFATATALGTQYCTAWFAAMEMVRLHAHDRVIIHAAAGGVGTALVQIARLCGCVVFGTTGTPGKMNHLRSIGVDYPLCTKDIDLDREFRRLSAGAGADVIFDSLGGASVRRGLKLLSSGGRIVCYGASAMSGPPPRLLRCLRTVLSFGLVHPVGLLLQSRGIVGINLLRIADHRPEIIERCLHSVVELTRKGVLRPVLGEVYPVGDFAKAHEMVESGRSFGKSVLRWNDTTAIQGWAVPSAGKRAPRKEVYVRQNLSISQTYTPTCES